MPHAHVTAARAARGRLLAVLVLSLVALAVEVVGAWPPTVFPCSPMPATSSPTSRDQPGTAGDLVRPGDRPARADLRLPAARDPGRGRQRRPPVRGRRVHPVRGVAAPVGSAGGRIGSHARRGRRRPRRERRLVWLLHDAQAGASRARRLSRGGRGRRGLGGGHRGGHCHRRDRSDRRRCGGVGC